jgi:hypothetical protein
LPLGLSPAAVPEYLPWLEEGFERARAKGIDKGFHNFEVAASAHVDVDEDVSSALARLKPEVALYVGGMGHKDKNFHKEMMVRRGYGDAADRIQELFLAGHKDEATAAVPDEWVDEKSLVGPPARIKQRYKRWEETGLLNSLTVRSKQDEAIEVMAEAARLNAPR